MSIAMIGIDYKKAPVDIRSLFSFTKKTASETMARLKEKEGVSGCILLSTCNRTELWISGSLSQESLYYFLCQEKDLDEKQYRRYFTGREEEAAIRHLFFLTSGLKSQILAEDQIITQVGDALALSRESYAADGVLEVLFRMAVTAAKKVKTDVIFSRANASVIHQAVRTMEKEGFSVAGKKCMVIGNGEMGKTAALALKEAGGEVTVTVRQYRSGVVEIPAGCRRIHYGERMELLPKCDLVVSATASPNYTLTESLFQGIALDKELILIDLAVPRDIDPALAEKNRIRLYDIDSFKVETPDDKLERSMDAAKKILEEQMEEFFIWYSGRALIPRVQRLQEEVARDLCLRLTKTIRDLAVGEKERKILVQAIDRTAGKVTGKLLYGIRDQVGMKEFTDCVTGLEKLYEE